MKRFIGIIILSALFLSIKAQERIVQNKPYIDLRPIHFGVLVGSHLQDIEFNNVGLQRITDDNTDPKQVVISTDQDRWDMGFTVGLLGEVRLNTYLQFRWTPAMYFGTRHIKFVNHSDAIEKRQEIKSTYISSAFDLIAAAPRFNNHRPYVLIGLNPMLNLNNTNDSYIKLKKYDCYTEIGVGCDLYLPYFKLRPELKFMYSLINSLDTKHGNKLRDPSMLPYTNSINKARSKILALTFYFE
ncbi:type IX secretion/gliding motility protein PorT/SprT [Segatella albensis]|jgi:hypothetical protein|uniref:type IX secretion/gliding motility protein PorT/SprT n=1 Tax=Segatella albensis TaxID=77768 RepID=UPI0004272C34|nr:porin family protein [Segatella albensis]